jgi:Transposase DDE domain
VQFLCEVGDGGTAVSALETREQTDDIVPAFEQRQVACRSQRLEDAFIGVECLSVIPPRANRSSLRDYDRQLYGERHLIENFFAKIKQFRATATRYEKTARNFLAAIQLVASVVWLN